MSQERLFVVLKKEDLPKVMKAQKVESASPCILLFSQPEDVALYLNGLHNVNKDDYVSLEVSTELFDEKKLHFYKLSRNDGSFGTDMYVGTYLDTQICFPRSHKVRSYT